MSVVRESGKPSTNSGVNYRSSSSKGAEINKSERKLIEQVADILDAELGDTEPYFPDGITDDQIHEEQPLFWACRGLNRLLMRQQTIEMKQRRIKSLKAVDIGVLASGPDQEFSVE